MNDSGASFVADVKRTFEESVAAAEDVTEVSLDLAGSTILLRIAGPKLAEHLVPALAHLQSPRAERPDFTISCWDRAYTGVAPPPPPLEQEDFLARSRVRGFVHHGYRITYDRWMRMLCVYDRDAGEAFVHVADSDLLPSWVDRAPMREVLTWWASDHDLVFLHASSVATDSGAVAISGSSGSGKSTTALACLTDGMQVLGDDACIVRLGSPCVAYAVYGFAKVEPDALLRLPALASFPQRTRGDQTVIEPGVALIRSAPLRALLLSRVGSQRTTHLHEMSRTGALRTLVAGSLLEGGGASGHALTLMRRLVEHVPFQGLELGFDMRGVVETVSALLDRS